MKSLRPSQIILMTMVLALAALVYFKMELVPVAGEVEWSEDAKRNPFLAAGQLLQKRGYHINYAPAFTAVPTQPGVLFLNQPGNSLPPGEAQRLLAWLRAGNELIMPASGMASLRDKVPDPLLSPLGVHRVIQPVKHVACADLLKQIEKENPKPETPEQAEARVPWLKLGDNEGSVQTTFSPYGVLEDSQQRAETAMADDNGVHVLRYAVGRGHITALSDTALFRSENISKADNAALLLHLVNIPARAGVWIIYNGTYPSLFHLLWQYGRPAILGLIVFAIVWLWWSSRRFGPLLPTVVAPRRQLSEHLRACGRYLWYAGQQPRLYKAMRASLRRRMMRRHPQWRHLSNNDLVSALAEFSGVESATLARALIQEPNSDLARFLNDVRIMNHVRKML